MKKKNIKKIFFQEFTDLEVSEVLNLAEIVSFPKNSTLFKGGDPSSDFYIISTGELEVFSIEKGEKVSIAIINSGSVVGEIGFLDKQERTATARSISDIVALKISHELFSKLEKENIKLAIKLILEVEAILANRLRNSDKFLVDYQTVKIDNNFLQKLEESSKSN